MQRTLIEWLRFRIFALAPVEDSQIVEHTGYVRMIRSQELLSDLECAQVEWFSLSVSSTLAEILCDLVGQRSKSKEDVSSFNLLETRERVRQQALALHPGIILSCRQHFRKYSIECL